MQIFSQYIINQYFLQNTVEIICKDFFFDAKEKTDEKRFWQLTKICLVCINK